ncbi:MAG: hypothetical protein K2O65_17220 [Lachnospiraceae bacterium]|nr:hypothetical protein [Lachnospiraceae bacterium]
MKRKSLWKGFGAGMLAFSLFLSPIAGAGAQATEEEVSDENTEEQAEPGEDTEDPMVKKGGEVKDLDPLRTENVEAEGTEGEEGYKPAKEAYADTEIPVWAYSLSATVKPLRSE